MSTACHGLSECKTFKEQEKYINLLEEECKAWKEAERLWSRVTNFQEGPAQDKIHDQACLASRKAQALHKANNE